MSRIIIPRAGTCSAKTVSSTDWELYFADHLNNYVICGLGFSAQCPNILAVDIATGNARLKGYHLNNSTTCSVTCLTSCSTNYIYMTMNRNCCCQVKNWTFSQNTCGCTPADSLKIGTATTDACGVTAVCTTCPTIRETIPMNLTFDDTELSSTPVCDTNEQTAPGDFINLGNQITLPTDRCFYNITAIEWKNGTVVCGNMIGVAVIVDQDPPVDTPMQIIAWTAPTAICGTCSVQKANTLGGILVRGGTKITGGIIADNTTTRFRIVQPGTINNAKAHTYSTQIAPFNNSAWQTGNTKSYVKIYYRGI